MSRRRSTSCLLWFCGVTCALTLDIPQDQVVTSRSVSGVFLVSLNNKYSFNASVSSGVCRALHVDIATKDQVQTALNNGLELCKFGWVEEKIVVVPRIQAMPTCGNNGVGLVTWRAPENRHFAVFCFNNTGTITIPRPSTTVSTVTTARQERRTSPPRPAATTPLLLIAPTLPKRPSPTTSTKTHIFLIPSTPPPVSRRGLVTTTTTATTTTTIPTTTATTTTTTTIRPPSSSRPSSVSPSVRPSSPPLHPPVQSVVPATPSSNQSRSSNTAEAPVVAVLITIAIVVTALAVLAMYYKKKEGSLPFRRQPQQKGAVETEMFKHFRERDLKRRPSAGDAERSRKCSSDITLLMEQEAKADMA